MFSLLSLFFKYFCDFNETMRTVFLNLLSPLSLNIWVFFKVFTFVNFFILHVLCNLYNYSVCRIFGVIGIKLEDSPSYTYSYTSTFKCLTSLSKKTKQNKNMIAMQLLCQRYLFKHYLLWTFSTWNITKRTLMRNNCSIFVNLRLTFKIALWLAFFYFAINKYSVYLKRNNCFVCSY